MKRFFFLLLIALVSVGAGCRPAPDSGSGAWSAFSDSRLGFTFMYPDAWGQPDIREEQGTRGGGIACISQRAVFFSGVDRIVLTAAAPDCEPPGRGGYWGDRAHAIVEGMAYKADCETGIADVCETFTTRGGEFVWHMHYPSYMPGFSDDELESVDIYMLHNASHQLSGIMASEEALIQTGVPNSDADLHRLIESIDFSI